MAQWKLRHVGRDPNPLSCHCDCREYAPAFVPKTRCITPIDEVVCCRQQFEAKLQKDEIRLEELARIRDEARRLKPRLSSEEAIVLPEPTSSQRHPNAVLAVAEDDPFEDLNRVLFHINDSVDTHVVVPVAQTYRHVVPEPARNGIRNAFANLGSPVTWANDVLQGE